MEQLSDMSNTYKASDKPQTDMVETLNFEPIKGYPMLNWRGKRPFTSTHFYPAQLKEQHGGEIDGWLNKIFWGDNLQVMSHLLKHYRGKVDMVYIDPPFDSKADYQKRIQLRGQSISNDLTAFEEKQYGDIWTNDEYLQFIFERLVLTKELISSKGIICLHSDWHKNYLLRTIMDEVFGPEYFVNEIIWHYYNKMQGNIGRFASDHDTILVYSTSKSYTFNKIRDKRETPIQQIKRVWGKESQSLVNAKDENGNVLYVTSTHKTVDDVWRMSMLQPADKKEPVGYPTQKPENVIGRFISAFSNPGDLVFDCFMGSGTTQAIAMKMGRRFLGADINLGAIQTTTKRLIGVAEEIQARQKAEASKPKKLPTLALDDKLEEISEDEPDAETAAVTPQESTTFYTGFEVYNVNNYEIFRNPVEAKDILIEALELQKLQVGHLFDGERDGRMWKIMPVNKIATRQDLNEIIAGLNLKALTDRLQAAPNQPAEKITLVCMGHEPDLAATLNQEVALNLNVKAGTKMPLDVQVLDILRDRGDLQFKRDSEAKVVVKGGKLVIEAFYPMNLLSKLSLEKEKVGDWREMVDSVMVDFNYDGAVFNPALVDIPEKNALVAGSYPVPDDAGTIRVKITDVLSESLEFEVQA